jgi:hypothetical protein
MGATMEVTMTGKLTTKRTFPTFGPSVTVTTGTGQPATLEQARNAAPGNPHDIYSAVDGTHIARVRSLGAGRYQVQAYVTGVRGVR